MTPPRCAHLSCFSKGRLRWMMVKDGHRELNCLEWILLVYLVWTVIEDRLLAGCRLHGRRLAVHPLVLCRKAKVRCFCHRPMAHGGGLRSEESVGREISSLLKSWDRSVSTLVQVVFKRLAASVHAHWDILWHTLQV